VVTLSGTRWVHVDGDDVAAGAVYRDEAGDIPLSRRPRELLEFLAGNVVVKHATGADDRAREVDRTTWTESGDRIVFEFSHPDARGATRYEIVERSADRLVVERR
jgi:hypothetical protein